MLISRIMGLYFVIMAIIMVIRTEHYRNLFTHLKGDSGVVLVGATFSLIIGLILVTVHNFWPLNVDLLVTILIWLILIKSILWLVLPEKMATFAKSVYSGASYYVIAAITFIIGIILLVHSCHYII